MELQLFEGNNSAQTEMIASSVANTGSYSWTINSNGVIGNDFKVRVSSVNNWGGIYDLSNDYFALTGQPAAGTITITSPNGGESWQRGTTHTITWNKTGSIANVELQLFEGNNSGQTEMIANSVANSGSYSWAINSNGVIGNDFKVRVSSTTDWAGTYDLSNNNFTLTAPPVAGTITVTSPNGGESWQRGTTKPVTWNSSGVTGNVELQLFEGNNSGQTEMIASSVANTGSYSWTINSNGVIGNDFKVRVSSVNNWGGIYDLSNNYFALTAPGAGEYRRQHAAQWRNREAPTSAGRRPPPMSSPGPAGAMSPT